METWQLILYGVGCILALKALVGQMTAHKAILLAEWQAEKAAQAQAEADQREAERAERRALKEAERQKQGLPARAPRKAA